MDLIWAKREAIYFRGDDWTGSIGLIVFGKSAVWRKGSMLRSEAVFAAPSLATSVPWRRADVPF
jgi:hypothetical protein